MIHPEDAIIRLWRFIVVGVAWSFIYTAVSLTMLFGFVGRLDAACVQRQATRVVLREGFERDADWSSADQIWLDANYPAHISC